MKFPREEFTSKRNRNAHFKKHQKQFSSETTVKEYERLADKLQRTPVDNKNILGYMSLTRENRTAYCKYDKEQELFVVYTYRNGEPFTITCYKKNWRDFTSAKAIEYFDEIPIGK